MRNYRGFSIYELLIAIAVFAILAAIAVPSYKTFIQNYRLTATAENLYSVIQAARSEAVKRNATVFVSFNTTDPWCYGVNVGSACTCTTASTCNLGVHSATASGLTTLSTTGLSGTAISFEGTRGAASSSATITYTTTGGTNAMSLKIGLLGNSQLCSAQITRYPVCS